MTSCFRTSLACVDSDAPVKGCCEAVGLKGLARLEAKVTTKCNEVGDDEAGDMSRGALRLRECEGQAKDCRCRRIYMIFAHVRISGMQMLVDVKFFVRAEQLYLCDVFVLAKE